MTWYCTECGAKWESGNYCRDCGTVRYGFKRPAENAPAKEIEFEITRESVCAGDDCNAPHAFSFTLASDATLGELAAKVIDYVPSMNSTGWDVICGGDVIARLFSDEAGTYSILAADLCLRVHKLPETYLHCAYYGGEMTEKNVSDFITDGVLSYGVNVGRVVFEEEEATVYCVSDLPHISASDAFTIYQISPADYARLLELSKPNHIPNPAVPALTTDSCHQRFLCGESIYQARNKFTLSHVDLSLCKAGTK